MLPCAGAYPASAFVGKSQENKLTDQVKKDFNVFKKSRGYTVSLIFDKFVAFAVSILSS